MEDHGFPMGEDIKFALKNVNIQDFVESGGDRFFSDSPVEYMKTSKGVTKNISSPHMLVTLLHHLELNEGQKVLILGSKGGFLTAVIDHILGEEGIITLIESHIEVLEHTRISLENYDSRGTIRILSMTDFELNGDFLGDFDRILITGAVREVPNFLDYNTREGLFILGPFGGNIQQRLLKKERESGKWFDTDLGGVVFSPLDTKISERNPLDPIVLAEGLEDSFSYIAEMIEIDEEIYRGIEDLIQSLRELPRDIPSINENSSEQEIMDSPVMDLMMSEMERLAPIWPILEHFMSVELMNIFDFEDGIPFTPGGHEDLVP